MRLSSTVSRVRGFADRDIPQVAELHRKVFAVAAESSPELLSSYKTYFTEVFLEDPHTGPETASLVYEEDDGAITGFLGTVVRPMLYKGQPARARISSQFIVDPRSRGLAGLKLLSAYLAGPQDLSIGDEANDSSRELWEAFGGGPLLAHSIGWIQPVRPFRFAGLALARKKFLPQLCWRLAAPAAWALDALAARVLNTLSRPAHVRLSGEELTSQALVQCMTEAGGRYSLWPDYDRAWAERLLRRAARLGGNGRLHKVLLRTERDEIAGWFLYYAAADGVGEVLQTYAAPSCGDAVLDALFRHARRHGATVLQGRLDPAAMRQWPKRNWIAHCGRQWVLAHSRRPELLQALQNGDALLSRLEGEWCLHFQ
jgi:hypothetical protein